MEAARRKEFDQGAGLDFVTTKKGAAILAAPIQ
jgi:hypothetical protein